MMKPLIISGRGIKSRLLLGTGKFPNSGIMVRALEDSGAG